jgi:hypothetical protein
MTSTPKTSETLNLAADLLQERGWTQGPGGWPGNPAHNGTLCVEGSVMAALSLDNSSAVWDCTPAWDACVAVRNYIPPMVIVPPNGEPLVSRSLILWNDAEERTAEEVIATLRAVTLIEAAREDAELLAEMGSA